MPDELIEERMSPRRTHPLFDIQLSTPSSGGGWGEAPIEVLALRRLLVFISVKRGALLKTDHTLLKIYNNMWCFFCIFAPESDSNSKKSLTIKE